MKNRNYTGKIIFVGIDVHKTSYTVAVVCEGELVKKDKIVACPRRLTQYLKKGFAGAEIYSAYESGFCGFHLHRILAENEINNIVVHAASIEINSRDRVKTDKKDALKIAMQLSVGRLRGIHVPSKEVEDKRELTRLRQTLVKEKNRIAVRMKHKANYHGLIDHSDTKRVSSKWISELLRKKLSKSLKYTLETYAKQWHDLLDRIKEIDLLLVEQAEGDQELEKVYRSCKGIGPTTSRVLANELGDMSQFSSERDLFSYTGLTPSEYSSGEHRRQGHISRQGKPVLRSLLVQCSWLIIKYDPGLREVYERISRRSGAKRAIVAIARRLVGRLRACFRTGKLYQVEEEKLAA